MKSILEETALLVLSASAVFGSTCVWDTSQCGGKNYTGLKNCCSSKSVCTKINDYYSKCMPGTTSCSNKLDAQCGGKDFKGNTCCASGLKCTYRNEWFSKCMATSSTPSPTSKPTTSSCSNKLDSQCGGKDYKGNTCCQSGLKCTYRNEWFSKCMTTSATPSPTPKATTSSCSNKTDSQCGGKTFTGQTCCPSPLKCTYRNEWFSKCMTASSPTQAPVTSKPTNSQTDVTCPTGELSCGGGYEGTDSDKVSYPDTFCCNVEQVCMGVNGKYGSYSMCIPKDHPTTCDGSLCKNGGTITCGSPGQYGYEANVCACTPSWGGGLCDEPFKCLRNTETLCGSGNLISQGGSYGYQYCCNTQEQDCTKFYGPSGQYMSGCWSKTRPYTCEPNPCKNGGVCMFQKTYGEGDDVFTSNILTCDCALGHYGTFCEKSY